jgi:hypothetical protein
MDLNNMENIEWMKGKPITGEEINELRKQFKNNNIQTKTRWSDTERWIAAVIATSCTFGFIYWLYTIGYLLHFGIYTLLTWLVTMVVFLIKHLIDEWVD